MLYGQPGTVALFDIHSMAQRAPKFIKAVQSIIKNGYDVDYISDKYLKKFATTSSGGTILVPDVRFMPAETLRYLMFFAAEGGQVVFVGSFPQSIPGYGKVAEFIPSRRWRHIGKRAPSSLRPTTLMAFNSPLPVRRR